FFQGPLDGEPATFNFRANPSDDQTLGRPIAHIKSLARRRRGLNMARFGGFLVRFRTSNFESDPLMRIRTIVHWSNLQMLKIGRIGKVRIRESDSKFEVRNWTPGLLLFLQIALRRGFENLPIDFAEEIGVKLLDGEVGVVFINDETEV